MSMSYLDLARRLRGSERDENARRLDVADCMTMIREAFEAVEYVEGALALLDTDPDVARRFHDTEAVIDAAVKAGPTEGELRAALAAHVAVIREACQRQRAQQERRSEATTQDDGQGKTRDEGGSSAPRDLTPREARQRR
jgi:hypothetical protein